MNPSPGEGVDILSKFVGNGFGYIWFVILAIWGGTVNYIQRVKSGKVESFSLMELFGEWAVSGFAGLLTAFICHEMNLSWQLTAFATGIAGHMGGMAILFFEELFKHHYSKIPLIGKIGNNEKRRKTDDQG